MFEKVEFWRIVYYFCIYFITVVITFFGFFVYEIKNNEKLSLILALTLIPILVSATAIITSASHHSYTFVQGLGLQALVGTSIFVGIGVYYFWKAITGKGKDKTE